MKKWEKKKKNHQKLKGDGRVKYAKKVSHTRIHNHIYGINMKKLIQNFLNFHNKVMVHSIEFMVSYTKF